MKTFILSSIILCFCNTLLCLRKGEKSNKCIVTRVTIPYFLWLALHVTRVTHIQCPISQYRFTRYGYSLCHLIKCKKKEVMPNLNCAVQFLHYSFRPFQSWWEWLIQNCLCFCCCLCQLALLFTLPFFRARHLATQFLTLSCLFFFIFFCLDKDRFCSLAFFGSWLFLHILLFRQRQVLFTCLLCIMDLCTHFILLLTVIFIFTLSTELQMSLSQSFSDFECCERI